MSAPTLPAVGQVSRGRCVICDGHDPLLAMAHGAPRLEGALFRWAEQALRLPVWLPVDIRLYEELGAAALRAVNTYY